jgi:quercetin dioxygenase-like cupin family protein
MVKSNNNETEVKKVTEGVYRKVFYLKNLMTSIVDYTIGPAEKPEPLHSHPQEQISYIAKGQIFVIIGDKKKHMKKGDVFYVPSNTPHSIQLLSKDVRIIDSFSPVMEELF